MAVSQTKYEQNKELLKKFIVNKEIDPKYKLPEFATMFGCIYCILNKKTNKRYIGATYAKWVGTAHENPITQIKKRATDYLYEYNRAKKGTISSQKTLRPIMKAMIEDGFENFIMFPIAETIEETHHLAESYFIRLYKTYDPKFGYNVVVDKKFIKKTGTSMSSTGKRNRSDPVICINLNKKKIIFSESMKLFGDFMNSSKDMIKNVNRSALSYKGWFVFYIDKEKRDYILNAQYDPTYNPTRQHSSEALAFYRGLYDSVSCYLDKYNKNSNEYFSDFEILPELKYTD